MHTCEIGGVQRCKAEMYCFDTEFFISFYTSYEEAENLLTDLDAIPVKALLSILLTCSLRPCVCFTNLSYHAFR